MLESDNLDRTSVQTIKSTVNVHPAKNAPMTLNTMTTSRPVYLAAREGASETSAPIKLIESHAAAVHKLERRRAGMATGHTRGMEKQGSCRMRQAGRDARISEMPEGILNGAPETTLMYSHETRSSPRPKVIAKMRG